MIQEKRRQLKLLLKSFLMIALILCFFAPLLLELFRIKQKMKLLPECSSVSLTPILHWYMAQEFNCKSFPVENNVGCGYKNGTNK